MNGTMNQDGSSREGMEIGGGMEEKGGGRHGKITLGAPRETKGVEHRPKNRHIVRPKTREKGAWRKREDRLEKKGNMVKGKGIGAAGFSSQPTEMSTSQIMH